MDNLGMGYTMSVTNVIHAIKPDYETTLYKQSKVSNNFSDLE